MNDKLRQSSFQIHPDDNVCISLSDLEPGFVSIHGSSTIAGLKLLQQVKQGHKMANRNIMLGEPVIKYGVAIGIATCDIHAGEWVHLHNCKSAYDKRSSSLDVDSGAPTDMEYR